MTKKIISLSLLCLLGLGTSGYRGIMSPVYNSDGKVRVDK